MRHIVKAGQFNTESMAEIFSATDEMRSIFEDGSPQEIVQKRRNLKNRHVGMNVINLFYESSTRTRLSFGTAARALGADVDGTEAAKLFSSVTKGETLHDSILTVGQYADVIVLRHSDDDSSERAAAVSDVPIINAGSGKNEHPTQALLDLYTIKATKERLDNLNIVIGGDLKQGRTARSLAQLASLYEGNKITFVSTDELQMEDDVLSILRDRNIAYTTTDDLHSSLTDADVVYWTRLQEERSENKELRSHFTIGDYELGLMKQDAVIMHPLPRNHEIALSVDDDPRAKYWDQVRYGKYLRAALLDMLLPEPPEQLIQPNA